MNNNTASIENSKSSSSPRVQGATGRIAKHLAAATAALVVLSGCVTSPYFGQHFNSTLDPIPYQAWTPDRTNRVVIECTDVRVPYDHDWKPFTSFMPDSTAHRDTRGAKLYSVSFERVVPAECWDFRNGRWQTYLRSTQNGRSFFHFDQDGLECLGRENGRAGSISGFLGKGCEKEFTNVDTDIPYVRIGATDNN